MSKAVIRSIQMQIELAPEFAKTFTLRPLVEGDQATYQLVPNATPPIAVKTMANDDHVEIQRVGKNGVHTVFATYRGTIEDLGTARFALDNAFLDLAHVGLLAMPPSILIATDARVGKEAA